MNIEETIQLLAKRASNDPQLLAALENDPGAVLSRETGKSLEDLESALSDAELAYVTGGNSVSSSGGYVCGRNGCTHTESSLLLIALHRGIFHGA